MSFEVDWRAVGEESKSGDCIAMRFGDFNNNPDDQTVVLIDGGFKDTGEKVVDFIEYYYGTDTIDLVISTHPHADHISGLSVVFDKLKVKELLMHKPWENEAEISNALSLNATDKKTLSEFIQKSVNDAKDLVKLAESKGTTITEPFQGLTRFDGQLTILGPSEQFYGELISGAAKSSGLLGLLKLGVAEIKKAVNTIRESRDEERLVEPAEDAVTDENNTSVITLLNQGQDNFLFTADAGVKAIERALDYSQSSGLFLPDQINYFQVPHHGSKRNIGPSTLNRLFGEPGSGLQVGCHAYALVAKEGAPEHPSCRVTNALDRRGVEVYQTTWGDVCSNSDDCSREGWIPAKTTGFIEEYDEEE